MTYNGYVADLFFNACAIALWAAFLWRVLDGPRFSTWLTVVLAAAISELCIWRRPCCSPTRGRCAR